MMQVLEWPWEDELTDLVIETKIPTNAKCMAEPGQRSISSTIGRHAAAAGCVCSIFAHICAQLHLRY